MCKRKAASSWKPPFSVCLLMLLLRKQNQRDKKKKRTFNCRIEREFSSSFPFSLPSCFAAECEWATVSVHSLIKHNDISLVFPTLYPLATLCFFFFLLSLFISTQQRCFIDSTFPEKKRQTSKQKKKKDLSETLYITKPSLSQSICVFSLPFPYLFIYFSFSLFFFFFLHQVCV